MHEIFCLPCCRFLRFLNAKWRVNTSYCSLIFVFSFTFFIRSLSVAKQSKATDEKERKEGYTDTMVKLDVSLLRFMEEEDFRVLTALEMTMRNHDVAPTVLVERIAQLPHGGCRKRLQALLKHKMIHHENTMYDGYAMKYGAYDHLALHTLSKRHTVTGVGHRIGCGKESDIILVHDAEGNECVLKLQRLGRCSFRSVIRNRDYKGGGKTRHGESWFYLSRLASQKEYSFMKVLYDEGFPVPKPIDQNRHALVMELVPGTLLNNIVQLGDPEKVYQRCLNLMIRLGEAGLIHGDFNEFNLMITEEQQVVMIDFPQMVSINHRNAAELFQRDVDNLANFFTRRFKIQVQFFPTLEKDVTRKGNLDHQVFASGCFTKKQQENLEQLLADYLAGNHPANDEEDEEEEDEEELEGQQKDAREAKHADPNQTDDEEGSSSSSSDDEEVADERAHREVKNRRHNENFTQSGEINEDHLKKQIKRRLRQKDNATFYKGLHRNVQKGKQKESIRRQVKNATTDSGFFD